MPFNTTDTGKPSFAPHAIRPETPPRRPNDESPYSRTVPENRDDLRDNEPRTRARAKERHGESIQTFRNGETRARDRRIPSSPRKADRANLREGKPALEAKPDPETSIETQPLLFPIHLSEDIGRQFAVNPEATASQRTRRAGTGCRDRLTAKGKHQDRRTGTARRGRRRHRTDLERPIRTRAEHSRSQTEDTGL